MRQVELLGKNKFVAATLYLKDKVFVSHIHSSSKNSDIHSFCRAQIAPLKADKTLISIPHISLDCVDVFDKDLVAKL